MRVNISAWSIRSPMPAIVTSLVLVILGLFSFKALPITRIPNIDIPIVQVSITQSGAAPGELETQVTRKIEDAIAAVNGIWHIMSAVSDGSSVTTIQFYIGTNVDRALNDVKDQISKIRTDLPRTINEPIISRIDIEGLPIITYSASAPGKSVAELSLALPTTWWYARAAEHQGRRRRDAPRWRRSRNPHLPRPQEAARPRRHRGQCEQPGACDQC